MRISSFELHRQASAQLQNLGADVARTQQQIASYGAAVDPQASLATRLETLSALRTDEGYMAEVQRLEDGRFILVENHCPICAAATTCTGLCASEQQVFEAVLGPSVKIERTEHILAGERRCAYRITEASL